MKPLNIFLSLCSSFWKKKTLFYKVFKNSILIYFFNYMRIMRFCNLKCWTLIFILIFSWELRCVKTTWQPSCHYRHKNYSACALLIYSKWTPCNGTDCPLGLQRRYKGICCPYSEIESIIMTKTACKRNCNLSDSDFYELSPYISSTQLPILTSSLSTSVILSTIDGKHWHLY